MKCMKYSRSDARGNGVYLKDVTGGGEIQSTDKKTYFEDGKYKLYCRVWLVCNIAK